MALRLAFISDLHLGHTGEDRCWHNRLLFDHAEEITRAAVAALNGQQLDAVVVLGDLTQSGGEAQLALARKVLGGLAAPWYVLPGNHDWPAVRSGAFDALFAEHVLPEYAVWDGVTVAAFRDRPPSEDVPERYQQNPARTARLLARLEVERPAALLLCSHMPLLDGAAWAAAHGGKDAGSYIGGAEFVEELTRRVPRLLLCCGHQHWHHVDAAPGRVQVTTAGLIEYPMEARLLTLDGDVLTGAILPLAPEIAAQSLCDNPWVAGRAQDRDL